MRRYALARVVLGSVAGMTDDAVLVQHAFGGDLGAACQIGVQSVR